MLIIYISLVVLVLVSKSEPYWNDQGNTVTRYVPWFLINCKSRGFENKVIIRNKGQ